MTKKYTWSDHALSNLRKRHIDRREADAILSEPTATAAGRCGRSVVMGVYFDKELGERMLLRIIVEEVRDVSVVVTLYKTSRIGKYLPDAAGGEDQ